MIHLYNLTFTGFIQHETQNSKVSQHPVELVHPLQLYLRLEVEFLSQQPLLEISDRWQMKPWSSAIHNLPWTEFLQVDIFLISSPLVLLLNFSNLSASTSSPGPWECHSKGWFNFLRCTLCINSSLLIFLTIDEFCKEGQMTYFARSAKPLKLDLQDTTLGCRVELGLGLWRSQWIEVLISSLPWW